MRILLLILIFIGLHVNIYARKHTELIIEEAEQRKDIKFNHMVYTTKADKNGYFDCHHIYVIDPVSKLNILHQSDFMMNDLITDSTLLPTLSDKNILESNLSSCEDYRKNMSIFSVKEDIEFINTHIVGIVTNRYFYGSGAAHGHNRIKHLIYKRKNGMKLGWDDLFKDKKIEHYILDRVVKELASKEYIDFLRKDNNDFMRSFHGIDPDTVLMNFKKSGYFTVVNEGLKVQYNAYEIAPYASGQPSLIISKKVLKDYMHEEIYELCFSNKSKVEILRR